MLLGIISQCGPPPCTLPKKAFLSPSVWARREYIWKLSWKESLLICFKIARVSPVPTDRVGIGWWTLPPYVRDSLEDKSMLLHFKKAFPLTSLGHSFERRVYYLLLCFESYQGVLYSQPGYSLLVNNEFLNMFFHSCNYKISCFSELGYNSSVPVLIFWTASEALAPKS